MGGGCFSSFFFLKIADLCLSAFLGHFSSWCQVPGPRGAGSGQAGSWGVVSWCLGGYSSLKRTAGSSLCDRAVRTLSNFS